MAPRTTVERASPMGRWADQENDNGRDNRATERDQRGSEPTDQPRTVARDLARVAYVAKDGTPRNVPIGFTWNGSEIVMCTAKNAPKLPALRKNPTVALTIDTEVALRRHGPDRRDPDVGEADRLRDDSAERGRGAGRQRDERQRA